MESIVDEGGPIERIELLVGEYEFFLREIDIPIRIKLWRDHRGTGPVTYTQSHHIETRLQVFPFETRSPEAENERAALDKVIDEFERLIKFAVKKGHQPEPDWLVPNEEF